MRKSVIGRNSNPRPRSKASPPTQRSTRSLQSGPRSKSSKPAQTPPIPAKPVKSSSSAAHRPVISYPL